MRNRNAKSLNMSAFEKISRAREVLELPESASMDTIKANYRRLLAAWHPDRCEGEPDRCAEMTREIIESYRTIIDYCSAYQYAFTEDVVGRNQSPEEWWYERFENDPLWGSGRGKK